MAAYKRSLKYNNMKKINIGIKFVTSCFIAIITAYSAVTMIFFIISSLYYVDSLCIIWTQVRILLHVCSNYIHNNMQN